MEGNLVLIHLPVYPPCTFYVELGIWTHHAPPAQPGELQPPCGMEGS